MFREFIGILLISVLVSCVYGVGHYTIVAPEHIRPHSDYQVSITLHNQTEPTKIKLSIGDGGKYKYEREVTVDSAKPELVTLHLDEIEPNSNYKFVAEGLSGIIFKNESDLSVEKKNVSLFIQTDKAIYKPGETIKFRVLVLDQLLRPAPIKKGELTIHISDAQKNRIKQWKGVSPIKGVLSDELQLSELPILGDWTITAEVGDETKQKTVEVAEYVLPKFEVTIDSPKHFSAKDGKVRAIIRSKYTYGKFVKGEAIVSLTPRTPYYHRWSAPSMNAGSAVTKIVKVDGKGVAEFDVEEDLKLKFEEYRSTMDYEVRATIIEELTGLNQTATKDITVHQTRYKFSTVDRESTFKSGLPVQFTLVIKHHDDSLVPVNENTKEVVLVKDLSAHAWPVQNITEEYFKYELKENGTIAVSIPTSTRSTSGFNIKVKFDDEEFNIGYFSAFTPNLDKPDFAVKILKKVHLNEPIFAEIESKEPLTSFTYQLIAHGKVIRAETVAVPNRTYHVIEFPATFDLAPTAKLVVYYFQGDELKSTHTDITVREDLNNYLKLKVSTLKTKPGSTVDIDVSTNPKSYVGLLGVDQSVLLLKKNDELSKGDAFNEIDQYQYQIHEKEYNNNPIIRPYYSDNYWSDFSSCSVILFTNAKKNERSFVRYQTLSYHSGMRVGIPGPPGFSNSVMSTTSTFSSAQSSMASLPPPPPPPPVRKEFPETWLWQSITDDNFNGTQTIQKTVPDTITSWVITGFSIDPVNGLGLTKSPKILEVFQPFFVSLNLPYSVKRGEVLTVPVVVFNYLNDDAITEVTLLNEYQEFEFVGTNDDNESNKGLELSRKKQITVPSNNGASASFVIRPTKVGPITINVVATTALAGDAVIVILPVEAEGVPQFVNKALLVDLRDVSSLESTLTAEIPENAVPDSTIVEVNCVGDLLGGTIKNLHQLIRLPSGCGEQNMLNFVPNIVILNYLKATGQVKPDIERKTKKYTESGYQRQLTYRHDDGSFSAFGKSDRSGSTWLTAFVAKSFRQAATHINIEESIIVKALDWLSQKQSANGSFPEVGKVSHKDMQGGSGNGVALTAYTLITFLENKDLISKYQSTIDKAIENIVASLEGVDDVYALGVASYALQLANHKSKSDVLQKLLGRSTTKDGLKWWRKSIESNNYWGKETKTINVEITSYGLLTLLDANQFNDGFPYFKWLLSQRNAQGGFEGTQDTIVGLQALAKFAERISTKENNVQIVLSAKDTNETQINVNPENALILQSDEFPSSVRSINVKATGKGFALLQLSYRYNLNTVDASPAFNLKSKLNVGSNEGHFSLEICSSFIAKDKDDQSNMVVLETSLPSGFTAEKDLLYRLTKTENVKKVETKNGETKIVVYFDSLSSKEECVTVDGYQTHKVAEQKPASIVIYDYYDSSRSARDFYTLPKPTTL